MLPNSNKLYRSAYSMFNKVSCRACGSYFIPTSVCNICREYVTWMCTRCGNIDDVTHSHTYSLVPYKTEKTSNCMKKSHYYIAA